MILKILPRNPVPPSSRSFLPRSTSATSQPGAGEAGALTPFLRVLLVTGPNVFVRAPTVVNEGCGQPGSTEWCVGYPPTPEPLGEQREFILRFQGVVKYPTCGLGLADVARQRWPSCRFESDASLLQSLA